MLLLSEESKSFISMGIILSTIENKVYENDKLGEVERVLQMKDNNLPNSLFAEY